MQKTVKTVGSGKTAATVLSGAGWAGVAAVFGGPIGIFAILGAIVGRSIANKCSEEIDNYAESDADKIASEWQKNGIRNGEKSITVTKEEFASGAMIPTSLGREYKYTLDKDESEDL